MFGLLGANGAGKSTTIKMLITLLRPTAGSATVAGYDIARETAQVRQHIGYVPQLISSDGALTGRENLLLSARLYHLPSSERRRTIDDALDFMGLSEVADRLTKTYSGGMVRRLEVAQAMLHRPAVLFLDEPTVGLDPTARSALWEHVRGLCARFGTTVVLTTHYMEEAEALCDRVAFMVRGRVVASGSPRDLELRAGPDATLDDVFTRLTANSPDSGGTLDEVARARRIASRLG